MQVKGHAIICIIEQDQLSIFDLVNNITAAAFELHVVSVFAPYIGDRLKSYKRCRIA